MGKGKRTKASMVWMLRQDHAGSFMNANAAPLFLWSSSQTFCSAHSLPSHVASLSTYLIHGMGNSSQVWWDRGWEGVTNSGTTVWHVPHHLPLLPLTWTVLCMPYPVPPGLLNTPPLILLCPSTLNLTLYTYSVVYWTWTWTLTSYNIYLQDFAHFHAKHDICLLLVYGMPIRHGWFVLWKKCGLGGWRWKTKWRKENDIVDVEKAFSIKRQFPNLSPMYC